MNVDGLQADEQERPRLLLVDDEQSILNSLRRLLRKEYEISSTSDPQEALELLDKEPFAVLLTDQRMPKMEGTALARKARDISPDTVRMILTGYADINAAIEAINEGAVYRFLQKPWIEDDLFQALLQAVQHYDLQRENRRLTKLTKEQNEKLEAMNEALRSKVFERTRQVTELNQSLIQNYRVSFQSLARLADMHSQELGNHLRRVATMSKKVGRLMQMGEKDLFQLEVAAALHDIGKVGMDPNYLRDGGTKLRAKDRAILLTHAVRGGNLIEMTPGLEEAAAMVRYHHENYDGSGSPDGRAGDDIPLGARIIATVDAYDNWAFRSDTSSDATSPALALQYVHDRRGSQFDPHVVEALTHIVREVDGPMPETAEVEVALHELRPGMVLARSLRTLRGNMLLPQDTVLEKGHIPRLMAHHDTDPIVSGVYIYRKRAQVA